MAAEQKKAIGRQIRKLREAKHWTQPQLAAAIPDPQVRLPLRLPPLRLYGGRPRGGVLPEGPDPWSAVPGPGALGVVNNEEENVP